MPASSRKMSYAAALKTKTRATARKAKAAARSNENSCVDDSPLITNAMVGIETQSVPTPSTPPSLTRSGTGQPASPARRTVLESMPLNMHTAWDAQSGPAGRPAPSGTQNATDHSTGDLITVRCVVQQCHVLRKTHPRLQLSPLPPSSPPPQEPISPTVDTMGEATSFNVNSLPFVNDLVVIADNPLHVSSGSPHDSENMWAMLDLPPHPAQPAQENTAPISSTAQPIVGGTFASQWDETMCAANVDAIGPLQNLAADIDDGTPAAKKRPWNGSPTMDEQSRANRPRLGGDIFADSDQASLRTSNPNPWLS